MSFIIQYPEYIESIRKVTKQEYLPILDRMEVWDPHDLIQPDTWFPTNNTGFGYVYQLFLSEIERLEGKG